MDHGGYEIGDYVKAPHALYDSFPETFLVSGFTHSLAGTPLVKVVRAENPGGIGTTFYPSELSYEDGTYPTR